jgi:predicted unusual protein kinase regulating ubiquinone biosynthesis (AarF/ABC1/UbiB family)
MARDFVNLGFLAPGTDIAPLVPALESIWADSVGRSLQDFNFRSVTSKFNELVYEHPIRIPERYALVIRSLLTQEGICLRLRPSFHFLEVAYPYVARRLLTDDDPALRERLLQVLLADGRFQWERLENLLRLAKNGNSNGSGSNAASGDEEGNASSSSSSSSSGGGLDLSDTVASALRLVASDGALRAQLLDALTEGDRLHVAEVARLLRLVSEDVDGAKVAREAVGSLPALGRQLALAWADGVLSR